MVKRYNFEIGAENFGHPREDEDVVVAVQCEKGQYVTYELYERTLRELNNAKYGKTCCKLAKKIGVEPKELAEFIDSHPNFRETVNTDLKYKGKKIKSNDLDKIDAEWHD